MNKAVKFDDSALPFAELKADEQEARLREYAPRNVAMLKEQFDELNLAEVAQPQSFDALEAAYGSPSQACVEAIKFTRSQGLLVKLAERMAFAKGPDARRRVHAFGNRGAIAIAQGVFDTDNDLTDATVLFGLCEVNRAICVVLNGKKAVGTGILVENDLVLSAAHVFEDIGYLDDGTKDGELSGLLEFQFYSPNGSLGETAKLAKRWKVAYAKSCIKQSVNGAIPHDAATSLDYILVKLDRAIPANIPPLNLGSLGRVPEAPLSAGELGRRYYIMGYPGGRDAKFSFGAVVGIDKQAARILHRCGSDNGMSGSPLMDASARIIALHEGRIENTQGEVLHNRATLLRSISAAIESAKHSAAPAPAYINSAGLRRQWAEYGMRAGTPSERKRWRQALASAGVGERGEGLADPADDYYPIFHFSQLQDWLDLPAAGRDSSRVLCVEGGPGQGKSFALQYAQARYSSGSTHLVNADISSGSSLPDMLARLHPTGSFNDITRPAEGRLRRNAESVLGYFEELAAQGTGKHLLVAVDLAPAGAYWEDAYEFWRELALLCTGRSTVRLLLCGPSEMLRNELNMLNIGRIVCPTITFEAVERHCEAVAEQLDMASHSGWAKARAGEQWNEERPGTEPRYAVADAARIVIQVRNELIAKESADE